MMPRGDVCNSLAGPEIVAQQLSGVDGGDRLREQIPLTRFAAQIDQQPKLRFGFNAFCDHSHAELASQAQNRFDDRAALRIEMLQ